MGIKAIIAMFIGGGLGALCRFGLSEVVNSLLPKNFPWGILAVNLLGCFLVGLLAGLLWEKTWLLPLCRAGIFIGLLGGFTTFSSFSLDTVTLFQTGAIVEAVANILVSVMAGLFLTAGGLWLGKFIVA